jgi:4-hydroxy-tetrahydrodipicolinate synthase
MINKVVHGVTAAVLTPRLEDETLDISALRVLVRFLLEKGVSSFAINGATGEFCLTTPDELSLMLQLVNEVSEGQAQIICGVGAANAAGTLKLIRIAERSKVKAVLLPMPYFFPYEQQDLEIFCRTVAESTSLPVLLYNLPQFTSGLHSETVERLIREVPNIIGIKDSSGSLEILRNLVLHKVDANCIIGNDSVLAQALLENVCDGVISGVACVLPELILALYAQSDRADSSEFLAAAEFLNELIVQLNLFPTPWGLKWMAQGRRLFPAHIGLPISRERREMSQRMMAWLFNSLPTIMESIYSTGPR